MLTHADAHAATSRVRTTNGESPTRARRRRELRSAPERHEHGAWELLCLLRERDIGPSAEMRTFSLRISRPVQEVDEHVVLIKERESELVCHS